MNTTEVKNSVLTPEIIDYIKTWKDKPGNLIMVLHRVQEHYGYIPRATAFEVANLLDIPVSLFFGVVTFYHFFKLEKPGKHNVQICMGTACYLKGAEDLIDEMSNLLGCGINGTTKDGEFSMEAVRCIGCCGLAPVLMIDGEVYGNLVPDDLAEIVAKYKGT